METTNKEKKTIYNKQQVEYLKLIKDKGDTTNNYNLSLDTIYEQCNNKNKASVRSQLTSSKMKTLLKYNKKSDTTQASVELNDKITIETITTIIENNKDNED